MNNQEAFDKAVSGVIKQGSKSFTSKGCKYRGPNGLKCAVGHLIPDYMYEKGMEMGIRYLYRDYPIIQRLFEDVNINMLIRLQIAHDNADEFNFVEEFKQKVLVFAEDYNLNTDVLK